MLQPDSDPEPTTVRIHRCGYVSPCRAHGCLKRATLIAEKIDSAAGWLPENLRAEAKEMVALETMALEAIRPDAP